MIQYYSRKGFFLLLCFCTVLQVSSSYGQTSRIKDRAENPFLSRAQTSYKNGNYNKAVKDLKRLFKQESTRADDLCIGHFLMGLALTKRNKYAESKYHFKFAIKNGCDLQKIEVGPLKVARDEFKLYQNAFLRYASKDYAGSQNILKQLLGRNLYKKDRIQPLMLMGRNKVRRGNREQAQTYFKQVCKIDKTFEPDPGKFKFSDELELFLSTKEQGCDSWLKRNWRYVAGGVAAVAIISVVASSGGDESMAGEMGN